MEEDQNRLLLILLLPRFLPPKWSPDVECETILALWSARTARECIDDALRLGREAREVDRFSRSLRTITGVILLVTEHQILRIDSSEHVG